MDTILVERNGPVATVTLNRPNVLNALNLRMLDELGETFAQLGADPSLRAVIVTGAGQKAFAAGADIGELNALPGAHAGEAQARKGQALTRTIERLRVPVIAAVNGFALGGGCELAMACDIRVASENAKFGQPEVNLGLLPGYGGTQYAARQRVVMTTPYFVPDEPFMSALRSAARRACSGRGPRCTSASPARCWTPRRRCESASCRRSCRSTGSSPKRSGSRS